MLELDELMRYRDYWNQRLSQAAASWQYRDSRRRRSRSDSSPVSSVSDSTSSEQGFHLMQHFLSTALFVGYSHKGCITLILELIHDCDFGTQLSHPGQLSLAIPP